MKKVEILEYSSFDGSPAAVATHFHETRIPVIIRGVPLGPCLRKWTGEYLKNATISTTTTATGTGTENVDGPKMVKVHRSPSPRLDFISKNFKYETIGFPQFIDNALNSSSSNKEFWYLRSLGQDPRGKDVSDLSKHFPELSKDLVIPQFFDESRFFSSVFRITSANLQLWTHYDTCDNILIQIKGRKRIVLFPPNEALNLYLDGDKSVVLDIDTPDVKLYPKFYEAKKYEGFLEEGDLVFIPSLWFHNITALDFSVSVNVFWKNLDQELYDKKDTYGNREVIPAQLAFKTFDKALLQLKNLPNEYEDFYLRRMIISLQSRITELELKSTKKEENERDVEKNEY